VALSKINSKVYGAGEADCGFGGCGAVIRCAS